MQYGLLTGDDQSVTRVMASLEADHALSVIREPIYYLAFALIAPLSANDDHILNHVC